MAEKKTAVKDLTKAEVAKMSAEEQSQVKNSLLSLAASELRKRHTEEYEKIASELFAKVGLERKRRLSPTERKQAELKRLAAELGVELPAEESASA